VLPESAGSHPDVGPTRRSICGSQGAGALDYSVNPCSSSAIGGRGSAADRIGERGLANA
jgi:hypothetical protein